jgi:hypothetical protein
VSFSHINACIQARGHLFLRAVAPCVLDAVMPAHREPVVRSQCCGRPCYPSNSASSVVASWRSAVSKPSVNQL